ncbi:MAG: PAS domain-containing methyl-accepting chemotaxis protein [Pseudomonadota bacterium]
MRKNLPVTEIDTDYPENITLISSTNLKGAITYVNEDFQQVSGFTQDELLGQNHNIVRHPDMPPAAFADMWDNLKTGKPWLGLVKNRCKNGNHYWVEAHVTPLFEEGKIKGYESVRVKPKREHVARAERLYTRLWKGKAPFKRGFFDSIRNRILLAIGLATFSTAGLIFAHLPTPALAAWVGLLGMASFLLIAHQLRPLTRLGEMAREVTYDPVTLRAFTGRLDETAQAEMAIRMLQANNRTILRRIKANAQLVSGNAHLVSDAEQGTVESVAEQEKRVDVTAAAMNEMSLAIHEIARVTSEAARAANDADRLSNEGREVVVRSIRAAQKMADDLAATESTIVQLNKDSEEIGAIINVIRYIAEQTNLLALNAAIEAARAGEQGRGFAVVADEVRSLAVKTQEATAQIQRMIGQLQGRAQLASEEMQRDEKSAKEVVSMSQGVGHALDQIANTVSVIHDMNTQIAAAVEEQSMVSGNITENINMVRTLAGATRGMSAAAHEASDRLAQLADEQRSLVEGFSRVG